MTKSTDRQKLSDWRARLARYRASDLTVARFCKQEKVSVASFYYWTKRCEQLMPQLTDRAVISDSENVASRNDLADGMPEDVVQFWFNDGLRVVIPARCSQAVRCLLEWSRDSGGSARGTPQRSAFKQLVVASR